MSHNTEVAVITGAASGIGFAAAKLLVERGWSVVLADVEGARLNAACDELGAEPRVIGVATDVRDDQAVEALAEASYDRFKRVDVVFNNAGVSVFAPMTATTYADWQWVLEVNLWGAIHGARSFVPRMIDQGGGGHILFTSSYAGVVPSAGLAAYCVSKYGVTALAEVLHLELAPHAIGVSVLCPMRVATDIRTSERNRPAELSGAASEPTGSNAGEVRHDKNLVAAAVLPPEAAAEAVLGAIGTDQLYVFSHPEMRSTVARRWQLIDQAFDV